MNDEREHLSRKLPHGGYIQGFRCVAEGCLEVVVAPGDACEAHTPSDKQGEPTEAPDHISGGKMT